MGGKGKLLIIFLIFPIFTNAQKVDFKTIDSITYNRYINGEWDNLIAIGKQAIKDGTDYKFLRQRLGYAFFMKGDYYNAANQFTEALKYDSYDQFSIFYIYYSNLNKGKELYSGIYLKRLDDSARKTMNIKSFKALESIEAEYDYKYSGTALRTNPNYFRLGFNSSPGFRTKFSQSFDSYTSSLRSGKASAFVQVKQVGYYAGLNFNATKNLVLKGAYHLLVTTSASSKTTGNLFLVAVSPDFNRFSFDLTGSVFTMPDVNTFQTGITFTYVLPVRGDPYIHGGINSIVKGGNSNMVYNSAFGLKIMKNTWLEGNISSGNMDRYNDFNGLYVYNSYDPMVFRSGGTFIYYLGRKLSIWLNFSFEKKEYPVSGSLTYNQFSTLTGFKWKL